MTQAVYIGAGFDADAVFVTTSYSSVSVYSDGLPLTDYSTVSYLMVQLWFIPRLKMNSWKRDSYSRKRLLVSWYLSILLTSY